MREREHYRGCGNKAISRPAREIIQLIKSKSYASANEIFIGNKQRNNRSKDLDTHTHSGGRVGVADVRLGKH